MRSLSTVLVIGAGIAGLAAAGHLRRAGHSVRVIEARSETGGRTRASTLFGPPVDLGASWLHGSQNHPLFDQAVASGLDWVATDYDNFAAFYTDGQPVTTELAGMEAYESALHRLGRKAKAKHSIADRLSKLPGALTQSLSKASQQFVIATALEEEYGADIEQLAALALEEGRGFRGQDVILKDSYRAVVMPLAQNIELCLNHTVTGIDYSSCPVTVTTAEAEFTADRVIVTVPLGVLKGGTIMFNPPLKKRKKAAINAIGSGVINKLYLRFPRVFWDQSLDTIGYQHPQKGRWVSWYDYSRITGEPILLGFNAASAAADVELLDDTATVADAMTVLRTIYGKTIPDPTGAIVTRWGKDPFALGAYSYLKVGSRASQRRDLAKSVKGRLYFAGEATDARYPATTQGAYRSGVRAAKKITG